MNGSKDNTAGDTGTPNPSDVSLGKYILGFLMELTVTLVLMTVHWTVAVVKFFLPTRWIGKDISGQTVLITGAGGGIGSLMAKRFADQGCNLVLWDINEEMNKKTAESVKGTGVKVTVYTVDMSTREAIYATADKVDKEVGQIDILVNNAGFVAGKTILGADDKLIKLTMDVNAMAHFWMAKAFVSQMFRRNSGHLVTIASAAGLHSVPGMADYCASKFAVVGFEDGFREELERGDFNDIKTTLVCPFLIKTPLFSGCFAKYPFILDALEPDYVAYKIVDAVLRNQEVLYLPRFIYLLAFLRSIMPIKVRKLFNDFAGSSTLMDSFLGRSKSD